METLICYDLEVAPDLLTCIKYGHNPIEAILYTKSGHPIVVPAVTTGQTPLQALSAEIARRMGLLTTADEKIYVFEIRKGQMPFGSPAYKTDPHRNVKVPVDADSPMKFEWMDYRDNDEIYDYYSKLNDGRMYLAWGRTGKKLIGGLNGLLGSFVSLAGNVEGAEMNSQIKAEFNWMGSPVPQRITFA